MTEFAFTNVGHGRLHKGKVTVTDHSSLGLPVGALQALADTVWALAAQYPPRHARRVTVTVQDSLTGDLAGSDGATLPDTGEIKLARNIWGRGSESDPGWFMPVADRVPYWLYVIAHEYGHLATQFTNDEWLTWIRTLPHFSEYGQTQTAEGVAEAFAQYELTGGITRQIAAHAMARTDHWEKPTVDIRTFARGA